MKRFGLPKQDLLRKSWEFMLVYRRGKRLKGSGFTLVFVANELSCSRLGISVHRMIRGAVRRNRIKRMIREAFRLRRDLFPQQCDIVVTVSPDFGFSSTGSLQTAVADLVCPGMSRRHDV
ncbi:MAG: ribonuclease P protein component [Desulfobulbaceae bacterium]|nr:ribonuclease P protein component [Desulfobulbaceae bacterium]MDY0351048.1 ribonuclease P protein component [Desulfobulbaceae bacterium]